MKHTPGPWAISNEPSAYMDGHIVSAGDHEVAGVWTLPDALLIAKAPDMYAMLERAEAVARMYSERVLAYAVHELLAKINQ